MNQKLVELSQVRYKNNKKSVKFMIEKGHKRNEVMIKAKFLLFFLFKNEGEKWQNNKNLPSNYLSHLFPC